MGHRWATRNGTGAKKPNRYWGRLKVCALKHANSDKPRTQNSNGLIAFSELGFEMFGHGQSGLLLGGEPAKQAFVAPPTNGGHPTALPGQQHKASHYLLRVESSPQQLLAKSNSPSRIMDLIAVVAENAKA